MGKKEIYLSLGSNVGERGENLARALALLGERGVRVLRASAIYETEPVDFLEQPWFLNCVVEAETELPPLELLHALRGIEAEMGSRKPVARGPRLIDLDILLYGQETINEPELQVPHPRMHLRRFDGAEQYHAKQTWVEEVDVIQHAVHRKDNGFHDEHEG
ncbi:MAG: 2-amino-4-hydroxy-6-hydroxymethyldihydropteridine diphosphokinase [Acidobacteriia bacterium]|nr:2-amino-4-hydroxy-6-hydroxymethyldihydropteridine diphosphokinase [Terriglobia bacterium]